MRRLYFISQRFRDIFFSKVLCSFPSDTKRCLQSAFLFVCFERFFCKMVFDYSYPQHCLELCRHKDVLTQRFINTSQYTYSIWPGGYEWDHHQDVKFFKDILTQTFENFRDAITSVLRFCFLYSNRSAFIPFSVKLII